MGRRIVEPEMIEPSKRKNRSPTEETKEFDISFTDDEALPPGLVLTDLLEKKWKIGKPIGRGSFGRIYLASDEIDKDVTKHNARYVIKIEPHTNGPLFVEVHCLIRTAKAAMVKEWRQRNKSLSVGMPIYIGSGSFLDKKTNIKYRFLVLPRYEVDLQRIIALKGPFLDLRNVLVLAKQIIEVLEYIHEKGYTHSDIKSSNLMIGFDSPKFKQTPVKPNLTAVKEFKKPMSVKKAPKLWSYYYDDDFIVSNNNCDVIRQKPHAKKVSKRMMTEYERRNYRHHAFNLRQLSNYVNYEDMTSSVCSDQSYQQLIDTSDKISDTIESNCDSICEAIDSQSNGQIYLLDFGLASKFLDSNGAHKEFCMDQRKAHDGTLEYSSRDSHIGAHSRRSDLETLAFNILDWLTGTLPWKTAEMLAEPDLVHALKKSYMKDVKSLLKTCFKTEFYPEFMEKYLEYITSLDFTEKPNYNYCKSLFIKEFIKNGFGNEKGMVLNLTNTVFSPNRKKVNYSKRFGKPSNRTSPHMKLYGRENVQTLENQLKMELLKKTLNLSSDGERKPCTSRNFFISDADLVAKLKQSLLPLENLSKKLSPKILRSKKRVIKKKRGAKSRRSNIGKFGNFLGSGRQFTWAEILAGNPENIIRKERSLNDVNEQKCRTRKNSNCSDCSIEQTTQSPLLNKDYLKNLNPTYAMKEVLANFRRKNNLKCESDKLYDTCKPVVCKLVRLKDKTNGREKDVGNKSCQKIETRGRKLRSGKGGTPAKNVKKSCDKTLRKRKTSAVSEESEIPSTKTRKTAPSTSNRKTQQKAPTVKTKTKIHPETTRVLRSCRPVTRSVSKK